MITTIETSTANPSSSCTHQGRASRGMSEVMERGGRRPIFVGGLIAWCRNDMVAEKTDRPSKDKCSEAHRSMANMYGETRGRRIQGYRNARPIRFMRSTHEPIKARGTKALPVGAFVHIRGECAEQTPWMICEDVGSRFYETGVGVTSVDRRSPPERRTGEQHDA